MEKQTKRTLDIPLELKKQLQKKTTITEYFLVEVGFYFQKREGISNFDQNELQ